MLVSGVVFERREKYRTFSYGLIGGGWAALYTTVYAMYAVSAAKVLDNAFAATLLLLAVAAGMIVHSLKYRSQTVTGLAYFLAFVTLAIAEVTTFGVLMLVPLAASLLYIAYRNAWNRFALFGLVATYLTCGLHQDTGSPLWQTQALFLVYWLIFEAFDLLRADPWLLPLNGARLPGALRRQMDPRRPESTSGNWPPEPPRCISPAPSYAPAPDAGGPPCSSTPRSPPPPSCSSCTISGCRSPSSSRPNSTTSPACASAPPSSATWPV